MSEEKKIINLNDAILAINPNCGFENHEPFTDYSKVVFIPGSPVVSKEDAEAKMAELQAEEDAKFDKKIADKASAKQKLIAGEALTEDEADTIVL